MSLVDPDGGVRTFGLDADGRLQVFIDPDNKRTIYQFDAASRRTAALLGSGAKRQWGYNAVGQIVTLIDLGAGAIIAQQFTFSYDGVGNRTGA